MDGDEASAEALASGASNARGARRATARGVEGGRAGLDGHHACACAGGGGAAAADGDVDSLFLGDGDSVLDAAARGRTDRGARARWSSVS